MSNLSVSGDGLIKSDWNQLAFGGRVIITTGPSVKSDYPSWHVDIKFDKERHNKRWITSIEDEYLYELLFHLSSIHRYSGASELTILEHSIVVTELTNLLWPNRPDLLLAAFLHDFHEAIVTDLPNPIKQILPYDVKLFWKELENQIDNAIEYQLIEPIVRRNSKIYSSYRTDYSKIKLADMLAGAWEAMECLPSEPLDGWHKKILAEAPSEVLRLIERRPNQSDWYNELVTPISKALDITSGTISIGLYYMNLLIDQYRKTLDAKENERQCL